MMKKIGIIGLGNMGSAIAGQIKKHYQIFVFDKDRGKAGNLFEMNVSTNAIELVKNADPVILAVKPQDFDPLLEEIRDSVKDKLIISIAAGITTGYIEKVLEGARVVRVMPNLPAKVGEGMSGIAGGKSAAKDDINFTNELFGRLGKTLIVSEDMMPAITAVSGSGPGFLCDLVEGRSIDDIEDFVKDNFIPSLTATAEKLGFTNIQAKILAETTGGGTVKFMEIEHLSPQAIKTQVASKNGTTEAGLRELKKNIENLTAAVQAALKRAEELSKS